MRKLILALVFALLSISSYTQTIPGKLGIIETQNEILVYVQDRPFYQFDDQLFGADSMNLFWTCDLTNQNKLFKQSMLMSDTLHFSKDNNFIGFFESYYPVILNSEYVPSYYLESSNTIRVASYNSLYESNAQRQLGFQYQNPQPQSNPINWFVISSGNRVKVNVISQYQGFYRSFNFPNLVEGQDNQITVNTSNFAAGSYTIIITEYRDNSCQPQFIYKYKLVVI